MTDRLAEIVRAYASRSLNVALALAFLLIPVRCDAASAAHSIFLTPEQSGVAISGEHSHSAAPGTHQHTRQGKAIPSKDMVAPHPAVANAPLCGDEQTAETSATGDRSDIGDTDTKSQSPVGATLYLPIPTALQTLELDPMLESGQLVELPLPKRLISAVPSSPEPPPPKPAHR